MTSIAVEYQQLTSIAVDYPQIVSIAVWYIQMTSKAVECPRENYNTIEPNNGA